MGTAGPIDKCGNNMANTFIRFPIKCVSYKNRNTLGLDGRQQSPPLTLHRILSSEDRGTTPLRNVDKALRLSKMSVTFYQSARRNIQKYFDFQNYVALRIKPMCCLDWNVGRGCLKILGLRGMR